jgi:hypothetical protein
LECLQRKQKTLYQSILKELSCEVVCLFSLSLSLSHTYRADHWAAKKPVSLRSTYRGVISNPVLKTYSAETTRQSDSKMDVEDPTTTERADSTSAKKKRIVEGEGGGATSKVASKQQQDETTTGFDRESGKGRRSDGEGKAKKRKL